MYADDTTLETFGYHKKPKYSDNNINREISKITIWLKSNMLNSQMSGLLNIVPTGTIKNHFFYNHHNCYCMFSVRP